MGKVDSFGDGRAAVIGILTVADNPECLGGGEPTLAILIGFSQPSLRETAESHARNVRWPLRGGLGGRKLKAADAESSPGVLRGSGPYESPFGTSEIGNIQLNVNESFPTDSAGGGSRSLWIPNGENMQSPRNAEFPPSQYSVSKIAWLPAKKLQASRILRSGLCWETLSFHFLQDAAAPEALLPMRDLRDFVFEQVISYYSCLFSRFPALSGWSECASNSSSCRPR